MRKAQSSHRGRWCPFPRCNSVRLPITISEGIPGRGEHHPDSQRRYNQQRLGQLCHQRRGRLDRTATSLTALPRRAAITSNTIGTMSFAAGEISKSFSIAIVDDSYAEGTETFTVGLNSPSGATLGAQSTATVTITRQRCHERPESDRQHELLCAPAVHRLSGPRTRSAGLCRLDQHYQQLLDGSSRPPGTMRSHTRLATVLSIGRVSGPRLLRL